MGELNIAEEKQKKNGIGRMKKANPIAIGLKIDMTPMVDLGFLLIAFFIFTTEISKPAVTKLYMPHEGDSTKIPESKSLTLLLASNDRVFYYYGAEEGAIKNKQVFQTSYNELIGLGHIIRQKQVELKRREIDKKELVVLIKPCNESSYRNVVNALDEMLINAVARYAIVNPAKEEANLLKEGN